MIFNWGWFSTDNDSHLNCQNIYTIQLSINFQNCLNCFKFSHNYNFEIFSCNFQNLIKNKKIARFNFESCKISTRTFYLHFLKNIHLLLLIFYKVQIISPLYIIYFVYNILPLYLPLFHSQKFPYVLRQNQTFVDNISKHFLPFLIKISHLL